MSATAADSETRPRTAQQPLTFQEMVLRLHAYRASRGCLIWQPANTEVGAGTMNPATFLRVLGPEPWRVAYVEPSVRPDDSRYGDNPNRIQMHTQYQVVLKPDPGNPQELYLESLAALGIDCSKHDIRFVEDNWESPALGAWGLGWEVWLDGLEITQFTYFQQAGGVALDPVAVEITYGLERIAMALQSVRHFKDIRYAPGLPGIPSIADGEVFGQNEYEQSVYNLDLADSGRVSRLFDLYEQEAKLLLAAGHVLAACEGPLVLARVRAVAMDHEEDLSLPRDRSDGNMEPVNTGLTANDQPPKRTFTRGQVVEQLRALGVRPGMTLLVHTSFRAVRPVEGGPIGVIAALGEALGPQGTLVMPAMTGSKATEPYDPLVTATKDMGVVAETFWRQPGVRRSDHPTSSFAAAGPAAAYLTRPQPLSPVHGPQSPVGWVHALDGRVLLLGVDHTANTTIHLGEAIASVPYAVRKWATVRRAGRPQRVVFDEADHCCRRFALVEGWLRERGQQAESHVGHARALLMRSRDVVAAVTDHLAADRTFFLCPPDAGCAECNRARASIGRRAPAGLPKRREE